MEYINLPTIAFCHINKGNTPSPFSFLSALFKKSYFIVIDWAFTKTAIRKKYSEATKVSAEIYTRHYLAAQVLKLLWYTWGLIGPGFTITEITPE
jgi:hypothetical protein